jgi:hypothetical protein
VFKSTPGKLQSSIQTIAILMASPFRALCRRNWTNSSMLIVGNGTGEL